MADLPARAGAAWPAVLGAVLALVLLGAGGAWLLGLSPLGQLAAAFIVPAVAGFVRGVVWLATGR
ncbi:MAG: hypothetical protein RLZ44_775 [Pseudomonadota bacterium]